jgi:hypothetical protein
VTRRAKGPVLLATFSLWPLAWLLVFVVCARIRLGFWPRYSRPDPADLHWPFLDMPPMLLMLVVPFALLASLFGTFRRWEKTGRVDWLSFC